MMIYRKAHRVLVQGITGKQGTFWTEKMMECGTHVVAGVNPKRAGEQHLGVPVYATAKAAMAESPFDVAVSIFSKMGGVINWLHEHVTRKPPGSVSFKHRRFNSL